MDRPLQVTGPSELIAVIPHVFGFVPEESVVLAPRHGSGPWARLDQPYGAHDISEGAAVLAAPFLREGVGAALVCFTTDREAAEGIRVELARRFTGRAHLGPSLWVDAGVWTDLVTGVSGRIDGATRTWADAELALAGRRMPVASREELRTDAWRGTARRLPRWQRICRTPGVRRFGRNGEIGRRPGGSTGRSVGSWSTRFP